jgi:hypothetical protein
MSILLLAALLAVLLCVYSDSDDVRPAAPQIPGAEVLTAVDVEPDVRLRGVHPSPSPTKSSPTPSLPPLAPSPSPCPDDNDDNGDNDDDNDDHRGHRGCHMDHHKHNWWAFWKHDEDNKDKDNEEKDKNNNWWKFWEHDKDNKDDHNEKKDGDQLQVKWEVRYRDGDGREEKRSWFTGRHNGNHQEYEDTKD